MENFNLSYTANISIIYYRELTLRKRDSRLETQTQTQTYCANFFVRLRKLIAKCVNRERERKILVIFMGRIERGFRGSNCTRLLAYYIVCVCEIIASEMLNLT